MQVEYKTVTTPHRSEDGSLSSKLTEAAADGWRYVDTLKASYWGSDQRLRVTVLMERPVAPREP